MLQRKSSHFYRAPIKKVVKFLFSRTNAILGVFDLKLIRRIRELDRVANELKRLGKWSIFINLLVPVELVPKVLDVLPYSKSQIGQDVFALVALDFKRQGFFVEFGATNGIDLSNSLLLERDFEWKGILAEPGKGWHSELFKNRTASIETNCVWKESNLKLEFVETLSPELSTLGDFIKIDRNTDMRFKSRKYKVQTISLNDLLLKYNAPNHIDYLSLDTEGSEYEILSTLDFSKYTFGVITCEHNLTPSRELIFKLLTKNGYKRVFTEISEFDDWYIGTDVKIFLNT